MSMYQTRNSKHAAIIGVMVAGNMAFASNALATVMIDYDFAGGNWTSQRQTAMNTAASAFSTMFGSHFSNSGSITLTATAFDDSSSGILAGAGSQIADPGPAGSFGGGEVIRNKLQGGGDLNGAAADGSVTVNFSNFPLLGLNDTVPSGTGVFDFYSTLFHEFTHALGFASSLNEAGDPYLGDAHDGNGVWATFDKFLVDGNGNRVVSNGYVLQDSIWNTAKDGGSSMYFNGANAVQANGGDLVNLYSPTTWSNGSSISHLDDDSPYLAGMMMLSATNDGPSARDYSNIEVGMLRDLGYTPVAVPEPAASVLILSALGVVGSWRARRRGA